MMTGRIRKLREKSLKAVNRISPERALLVTEFYRDHLDKSWPIPVQRAQCFRYIMMNKDLYLGENELIVGERGPAPKSSPTYPEICLHTLEDLEILDSRPKVSFQVTEDTKEIYKNTIIPYWTNRTNRELIFASMEHEWLQAYKAGIFTEFQEQRAPGHTVLGDKIYKKGMLDLIEEIEKVSEGIVAEDPERTDRLAELQAMKICAEALIDFAKRYATLLDAKAAVEKDPERKQELEMMAATCRRVPAHSPRNLREALQYYWFVHLGVITELNPWDSFNPGRLDQHLYPFYKKDLDQGILTREQAVELIQAFWMKFNNHPAPPKVGVTAQESNTYTDFCLINLGGLTADGEDAVNEMSYLLLDVIEEMRLLQPSSMIQISRKNPDEFIKRALKIIETGYGQPSVFNSEAIVAELTRQGKSVVDARKGGASGCVEAGAFGTESYILTGYFNLTKILEITLNNGVDPRTGKMIGLQTGQPDNWDSFENLFEAFRRQLQYFLEIKIRGNLVIEKLFAERLPVPFLSLLIDDCIANGKDYNAGGARYNTSYIQGVGLGSITDSLAAIRYQVFDEKKIGINQMKNALYHDFNGFEELRNQLINNTPKYGNDIDFADELAVRVFDSFFEFVDSRPTHRGGTFRINMLPTTCHVYFGSVIGATPDGRLAGTPLSEGISPVQGADTRGPTAVMKSAAKFDHLKTGGTLLNQKFSPEFFETEANADKLAKLIRGYFRMNGHHVQFNVVTADTLRKAQLEPEKYRDLIVRVAGYSDYFNDLGRSLQDEIIRRTEQKSS